MRDVISDADVVARVRAGETELFELLVRRHNQRLFRVARSFVATDDDAEEALQLAYLSAWRALDGFAGRSTFLTWMTRITIRSATSLAGRRVRRSEAEGLAAASATDVRGAEDEPVSHVERDELRLLLEIAIGKLPETYRIVFVLRAVEGLSTAEVARDLELTESAVKVRLMRAREKLQAELLRRAEEAGALPLAWHFAGDRCDRITAGVFARIQANTPWWS